MAIFYVVVGVMVLEIILALTWNPLYFVTGIRMPVTK